MRSGGGSRGVAGPPRRTADPAVQATAVLVLGAGGVPARLWPDLNPTEGP